MRPVCVVQDRLYMHLTNYSINKHSENYRRGDVAGVAGSKRSLRQLTEYLQRSEHDVTKLWTAVTDLIVKVTTTYKIFKKRLDQYRQHQILYLTFEHKYIPPLKLRPYGAIQICFIIIIINRRNWKSQ